MAPRAAPAFFYRDVASQVRADTIASLFYVNNWWYVFNDSSYFEFIGRPPVLKHLWSLAVEEQFYLVWPAIAYLVARRAGRSPSQAVDRAGRGCARRDGDGSCRSRSSWPRRW